MLAVDWFEIPATDFDRAVRFYGALLERDIRLDESLGAPHGFFAATPGGVGGAVIKQARDAAAQSLIYLDANSEAELMAMLERVEPLGGSTILPKTSVGEQGWIAIVADTEGNRVGLHARA